MWLAKMPLSSSSDGLASGASASAGIGYRYLTEQWPCDVENTPPTRIGSRRVYISFGMAWGRSLCSLQ